MEERWPEYKAYRRVPYQDIAYRAVGIWMKYDIKYLDFSEYDHCFYNIFLSTKEKFIPERSQKIFSKANKIYNCLKWVRRFMC